MRGMKAIGLVIGVFCALMMNLALHTKAATNDLPGKYQKMEKEPSLGEPGKVLLLEFADFYCPHCHMFEKVVVSKLKKEFGDQLEVQLIGFPVMPGKLPTAFEMYEQAKAMGKGPAMKHVLFKTIHKENIHVFDKSMRSVLIREIGLDVQEFEEGMATGKPYQQLAKGIAWGERIGVKHTPTVVLNGNIRVEYLNTDNLRTLIKGILQNHKKG